MTFVSILVFGSVSTASKQESFCNSQLMTCLRQVLDMWGVHERAGNRDGDSLDRRAFDPHITILGTNVTRQNAEQLTLKPDGSKRAKVVHLLRHRGLRLDTRDLFPGQQPWLADYPIPRRIIDTPRSMDTTFPS